MVRRVTLASLYLALLTSLLTAIAGYAMAKHLLEQRALQQLSIVASAKEDIMEGILQFDRERTALLAATLDPTVSATPSGARIGAADIMEDFLQQGINVLGVAIFDRAGTRLGSTGVGIDAFAGTLSATRIVPTFTGYGWDGHTVYTPIRGSAPGVLAIRYSASPLLAALFETSGIGETAKIMLARRGERGTIVVQRRDNHHTEAEEIPLRHIPGRMAQGDALAKAILGGEGVERGNDDTAPEIYVAYRALPTFGWGLTASLNRTEALSGLEPFSIFLAALNAFLLGSATVLSVLLARRITRGLTGLIARVRGLHPGHWQFIRTIHTGDEVELLDAVIADLTQRLQDTFASQEEEIAVRTAELKEQMARDLAMIEMIESGIILFDAQRNVIGTNAAAARLLGMRKESMFGHDILHMLPLQTHGRSLSKSNHPVLRCIETHQRFRQDPNTRLSITSKNGTLLPVLLVVSPILEGENCTGGIAVFQDVTEERQVDYMKSEFISLASHQLRTPLSAVLWYVELLNGSRGRLTAEQHSYVREMRTAAQRMSNLIDALLEVSRLEGGGITPVARQVDLFKFLDELVEEFRFQAKERKISVHFKRAKNSVKMRTDPTLLSIVLQNILSNAVKYSSPGGSISITLRSGGRHVEISVEDDGIGIPKKEQEHIFQKLFRAKNARKVDATGSGLGLYISKMIMGTLGGTIGFQSKKKRGTVVTVRLPLRKGR
jgi:PAS domain S-box-containing protein